MVKFLENNSNHMSYTFLFFIISFMIMSCKDKVSTDNTNVKNKPQPIKVIFETDIGNDVDDVLALDMLYKYADRNKVEILAISVNKDNEYAWRCIDILNTWYGYPKIPIGRVIDGVGSGDDDKNYARAVWEDKTDRESTFKGSISDYSNLPNSTELYRKILSQQPDTSVTIISVGFSTNLSRLLNSGPDKFSNLKGTNLVSKKVKLLSVMAGSFDKTPMKEYNVVEDVSAAQITFDQWPSQVIVSPFEVGNKITYPASSIENDFNWTSHHPLVTAYKSYLSMPYSRPTWDLTSVLYAIEGSNGFFSKSGAGKVKVNDEGYTSFVENPNGKHRYLKINSKQAAILKNKFVKIISSKPKRQRR